MQSEIDEMKWSLFTVWAEGMPTLNSSQAEQSRQILKKSLNRLSLSRYLAH